MESDGIVPVLRGLVCNNKADIVKDLPGLKCELEPIASHMKLSLVLSVCVLIFGFAFHCMQVYGNFKLQLNQNIDKFQKCNVFHFFFFTKDRSYFWQLWSLSCLHTNKSYAYVPALYYCIFVYILHIDSV